MHAFTSTASRPDAAQPSAALVVSARSTTPAGIARAIAIMHAAGDDYRAPLLRAVGRDEIAFVGLRRGQRVPFAPLDRTRRPSVLLVADDDHDAMPGPAAWADAGRMMRWTRKVLIHGTGGKSEHYQLAIDQARSVGRLLLIETCSSQIAPWLALASGYVSASHVTVVRPWPAGAQHPMSLPLGAVN